MYCTCEKRKQNPPSAPDPVLAKALYPWVKRDDQELSFQKVKSYLSIKTQITLDGGVERK